MNKQQSKYFNTASFFDEALITLLEKKDIDYITVKEICKQAKVNRSTFYLHYESIDDLLNETLEYINKKFISYFNEEPKDFIVNINIYKKEDLVFINKKYLKPYLEFIKENKKVFIAAFKNPVTMKTQEKYSSLEKYILNPILNKYNIPNYKKRYVLQFYINGIMAIIKEWAINDCKENIDDIIDIIIECVNI